MLVLGDDRGRNLLRDDAAEEAIGGHAQLRVMYWFARMTAAPAMTAVSNRRMEEPSAAAVHPKLLANDNSSGSNPPSGPIASAAGAMASAGRSGLPDASRMKRAGMSMDSRRRVGSASMCSSGNHAPPD